jgi:CheY-like chemotaxis protein
VQRAAALTQQLLAISRKTEIKFEELNVNAVLEKLKKLLSETFPKAIDIVLDLHPAIPSLIGDPNHIHQVLLNLCVNARDAMPEGGKLFVQTSIVAGAEVRKRFEQAKNDLYVRIQLADTGTGIDDATRNRIFEPFFTTKSQGQGTGLGLAVVYGIVTNHSGFIDVESEPGKGTTFSIYLPASNNNKIFAEEQKSLNNEKRAIGSGEVVLFVDDEERQLRLMQRFLTDAGYRVLVARDGIEAVEIHGQHSNEIAVAVLDLQLPKLNGWEAFQKMKLLQPNLQAIFATGFVSAEIEAEIAHAQRGKIIMKPYDLTEVLENVSAAARKPLLNNEGELGRD